MRYKHWMGFIALIFIFCVHNQTYGGIFNHKSFKLSNGLTVYVIPNTLAPVVHVGLYYRVGTADDPKGEHGLSHFLEHMMFKGTHTIPKGKYDELLLREGASYNAHTTPDYTCYDVTIVKDQLELVLFLEADRMTNLSFTKEDIESERQVVHEERAMRLDNHPFGKAIEVYLHALYWKHPYGIPAIGYAEHIDAYSYDSVREHYKTYYAPNNAILIVSGDTDVETVKRLSEKYFGSIKSRVIPERKRPEEPSHEGTVLKLDHYAERSRLVTVQYSYIAPNFKAEHKEHAIPLVVLSQIMAGNALSRFWKMFVEDEKVAVSVGASYDHVSIDPQTFDVSMTLVEGKDCRAAKQNLEEEIQKLVKDGITDEELSHAKRDILAGLAFVKDGLSNTVQAFSQVIFGIPVEDIEDWDKLINAVTKEQVNQALRFLFSKRPAVILSIYPKDYDKVKIPEAVTPPIHPDTGIWAKLKSVLTHLMVK